MYTYAYALCESFTSTDGTVALRSGTSVPLRVDATDRSATVPGDGTEYAPSIRRMVPPDVARKALSGKIDVDRTEAQLLAEAVEAFRTGTAG